MIAIDTFVPPHASSRKIPDQCIRPSGLSMPTVVFESGTEPHSKLIQDKTLWLRGGAGILELVFLFNWTKLTGNRIKGVVEIWNLLAGNENLIQSVVIINLSNFIWLTKNRLFSRDLL